MTEEERRKFILSQCEGMRNMAPGSFTEVPQGDLAGKRWYDLSPVALAGLGIAAGIACFMLIIWTLTADEARQVEKASMQRQSTATTLNICAARMPMMVGRMLKTEGEVLLWRESEGGLDIFLTQELLEGRDSCTMIVHLPPTVPETYWRPTPGERIQICGLRVEGKVLPELNPGWRCL